jgi:tetratricopeptide (TPR) repeat protein
MLALVLLCPVAAAQAQDPANEAWNSGDQATADSLYSLRLAHDSTDARALHRVALIRGWNQQYAASISLFDLLIAFYPLNWEAKVDRARVYAWWGRLPRAIAELDRILQADPSYVPALRARAQFLSWAGEMDDALTTYDRLAGMIPEDHTLQRDQALVLAWASRYQESSDAYEAILADDPEDRAALIGLARVMSWSGALDSAAIVYDRVLQLDPSDAEALEGRARVSAWQGQLKEAERRWRALIVLRPDRGSAHLGLAQTLRWQGRVGPAMAEYQRAAQLAPTDREVVQQLEWVHRTMQPRGRGGLTFESDSDDNNITTITGAGGWRPRPGTDVQFELYVRTASINGTNRRSSTGLMAVAAHQLEPGWLVRAGLGVTASDGSGANGRGRLLAALSSPGRNRGGGTLRLAHLPLDYTALLIENGVVTTDLDAGLWYLAGAGIQLNGGLSVTWYQGTEPNRRLAGRISARRRLAPSWTVGAVLRAFGFQKNLQDGYFDPDLYWLFEVPVSWQRTFGAWRVDALLAPGLQQVGTGGSVRGAGRAAASVGYPLAPGRELGAFVRFSSTGMDGFSTADADYRSLSFGLSGSWVF